MGRSKVWVNGRLLTEHFGGYLPVVVDVTPYVRPEGDNVVAVMTDNSDNPVYPPGKPQDALDFTYAGGIYRDCWLVAHGNVFITDPNYEDFAAGGGLFVAFSDVSERSAKVHLRAHVRNAGSENSAAASSIVSSMPTAGWSRKRKSRSAFPKQKPPRPSRLSAWSGRISGRPTHPTCTVWRYA